jgi:O-antigen biosynthesis protein
VKLFTSKPEPVAEPTIDIQTRPARFAAGDIGAIGQVKVDLAYTLGTVLVVAGWRSAPVELALFSQGTPLKTRTVSVTRTDVAAHLKLQDPDDLGFVLIAERIGEGGDSTAHITFAWRGTGNTFQHASLTPVAAPEEFSAADQGALGTAVALCTHQCARYSPQWQAMVARATPATGPCPNAAGYLEGAFACKQTNSAVVFGWVLHDPDAPIWLEDDEGHITPLDGAFRRYRQDVIDAVGAAFPHAIQLDTGFIAPAHQFKVNTRVRLKTVSEAGVHTISETLCAELSVDPRQAARQLFSLYAPIQDLHQRIAQIDEPLLSPIIALSQQRWKHLPERVKHLGQAVAQPRASIIVPLYGRTDFVEHQLVEFARDPWIREHAELVYVLDDPKLVDSFSQQAESLHRLYQQPFTWVWGNVNRGFSGANNLGAAHARGEHLVFLNSDAFPQQPGWLPALMDVLDQHPDIGAVGPRLVFGHGAIQHAGMAFVRRDELGIWINHHPHMGLDPSLDPCTALTRVPAITGACLVLRRRDFDRVGGWDTGYLIGDFEDSDLCLKLRAQGQHIAYLPTVQLTHLERQSFKLLGEDEFRTRVVVYNAVRHQNRWGAVIASTSAANTRTSTPA